MSRYLAPRRVAYRGPRDQPRVPDSAPPDAMMPDASDAVLSDIRRTVEAERLRSAAA
jgi:hypothetical protein